jgi:hypothetical protein
MQVMNKSQYQDFIGFGVLGGGARADRGSCGAQGHPAKFFNVVMATLPQPFQAVHG